MSSPEELAAQIEAKGQDIRTLKSEGIAKDALKPHIDELLLLKGKYKATAGTDYKAPGSTESSSKKEKKAAAAEPVDPNKKSKKQLQREKKEAEKAVAKAAAKEERERKQAEAKAKGGSSTAHEQ